MKPVKLTSRWAEIFGNKPKDVPAKIRRERWEQWKLIALADGQKETVDYWSKDNVMETCGGCKHREGDWCNSFMLPCNVNPIITFSENIPGMACNGTGYEKEDPSQLSLF